VAFAAGAFAVVALDAVVPDMVGLDSVALDMATNYLESVRTKVVWPDYGSVKCGAVMCTFGLQVHVCYFPTKVVTGNRLQGVIYVYAIAVRR